MPYRHQPQVGLFQILQVRGGESSFVSQSSPEKETKRLTIQAYYKELVM